MLRRSFFGRLIANPYLFLVSKATKLPFCNTKSLIVTELTVRFKIPDIKKDDGSWGPGYESACWHAVDFAMPDTPVNEVIGKCGCLRLQCIDDLKDIWDLSNAVVMLHPTAPEDAFAYVVTFDAIMYTREE